MYIQGDSLPFTEGVLEVDGGMVPLKIYIPTSTTNQWAQISGTLQESDWVSGSYAQFYFYVSVSGWNGNVYFDDIVFQ
jgi:hypothetical protein